MIANKTLIATAMFGALLAGAARAETCEWTPSGTRLEIIIEGVRAAKGLMTASLYPGDKSQFLIKDGAIQVWRAPAEAPQTRMCIWLRGPGTYALAIYQDVNGNHRFDHGLLGPTEPYGFSSNPRILLSPPSFDSVKFEAKDGETTLHVRLHNP